MAKSNAVIIKRVKKVAGGHHGGAWKVAYADFVTAMMAFFLLLWLLNATTDAQKRGIADYFSPTLATRSLTSGAGGVLGGRTMTEKGSMASSSAPPNVSTELNKPQDFEDTDDDDTPGKAQNPTPDSNVNANGDPNATKATPKPNEYSETLTAAERADLQKALTQKQIDLTKLTADQQAALQKFANGAQIDPSTLTERQLQAVKAAKEERQFEKLQYQLQQAIQQIPDLKPLAQNLVVERTSEGLNVQLLDQDKTAMFPLGSSEPDEAANKLMRLVAAAVEKLPNQIKITGHTDATPFKGTDRDNWDLSSDRANASRRALLADGVPASKITSVVGVADTQPFVPEDAFSPRNRRISIVILRDSANKPPADAGASAPPADGAAAPSTAPPAPAP